MNTVQARSGAAEDLQVGQIDPPATYVTVEREARMWVDLFSTDLTAQSAVHRVTERALIYLDCGLPLAKVLDAFKVTEDQWNDRLDGFDAWQELNRAACRRMDASRAERDRLLVERAVGGIDGGAA